MSAKAIAIAAAVFCSGLLAMPAVAAITPFDLIGKAGSGLLAGNENFAVVGDPPGSGGEVGAGISYDDVANILTVNVGWGSANGFVNLTSNANIGHIHGPTSSVGTASFTESASVRYGLDNLTGWNPSASAGGFIGPVTISQADEDALFAGRFYINIHTGLTGVGLNPGGEIRGNLVPVPEPQTYALVMAGLGLVGFAARRRLR